MAMRCLTEGCPQNGVNKNVNTSDNVVSHKPTLQKQLSVFISVAETDQIIAGSNMRSTTSPMMFS